MLNLFLIFEFWDVRLVDLWLVDMGMCELSVVFFIKESCLNFCFKVKCFFMGILFSIFIIINDFFLKFKFLFWK